MKRMILFVLFMALNLAMSGLAQAATITVGPGADYDFDTIQAGIDAAVDGDTVLVAPGEHVITEPITFRGKAITVKSEAGRDETTIRMGTPADINRGSVIIFENSETIESILEGFTITGGNGSWVSSASVYAGGAIYFDASSGTVRNCAIIKNEAGSGGGVFCAYPCSSRMFNCIIAENSAESGGGLAVWSGSSLTLMDCIIRGNSATGSTDGSGGGVGCWVNSRLSLTNCIVTGNSAAVTGGGIHTWQQSSSTVSNCVIALNMALGLGGGGMGCCPAGSAAVTNSIFWENTAPKGYQILVRSGATFSINYSNVAGGQSAVGIEGTVNLNWDETNTDAEPLFADPNNGDFHLKSEAGRWDPNSQTWILDDVTSLCIDAGDPNSDWSAELWPHGERINMGAYGGTSQASMSLSDAGAVVHIQWLGHSSVKVWTEDCVVYVDPEGLIESLHDATLVCVTHTHGDHYSPSDIARVSNADTLFVGPPDVVQQYGSGQTIAPGQTIEFDNVNIIAVPAYNTNKPNHPKSRNWVGFIIEIGSQRIYVAGDTDLIEEMKSLGDIDVAILPTGGTYTMNAVEAAEATQYIQPKLAIPYHWGRNIGTISDAETFAELAACAVKILTVGETISSDDWPEYSPLIAHWKLDETEGYIAYDSAGNNHGTLKGDPQWVSGFIDGALEFDGDGDYVDVGRVGISGNVPKTIAGWAKASTTDIPSWTTVFGFAHNGSGNTTYHDIEVDDTGHYVAHINGYQSPIVAVDTQWHHFVFTYDGIATSWYLDGQLIDRVDAGGAYLSTVDEVRIGARLSYSNYFPGIIDDVRIYNVALSAEEIEALAQ